MQEGVQHSPRGHEEVWKSNVFAAHHILNQLPVEQVAWLHFH